jgi:hypothetical protein
VGELLGIGCTHGPQIQFPDENMADYLKNLLRNRIPEELRSMDRWPEAMRREWGDDQGASAAKPYREEVVSGFRRARAALDAFKPDFVLIFGDDQYENFREDLLTPFCVFGFDEVDVAPYQPSGVMFATTNVWNKPTDTVIKVKGHPEGAVHLTRELIARGFDMPCSFQLHHAKVLSHAFTRTMLYLDYDEKGFEYPIVPFHVNCYGADLRLRGQDKGMLAPPSPAPWRCYDAGRAVASIFAESPWRVAIIGSSSWSHASLTKKHGYLYPDIESDRARLNELQKNDLKKWRELSGDQLRDAGQHEMLNWICLAGAMEGRQADLLAYGESYIFNSNKPVALFAA